MASKSFGKVKLSLMLYYRSCWVLGFYLALSKMLTAKTYITWRMSRILTYLVSGVTYKGVKTGIPPANSSLSWKGKVGNVALSARKYNPSSTQSLWRADHATRCNVWPHTLFQILSVLLIYIYNPGDISWFVSVTAGAIRIPWHEWLYRPLSSILA